MKLTLTLISFTCFALAVEGVVKFKIPSATTSSSKASSLETSTSCSSSTSNSSSSSSSDIELLRDESDSDGRFTHLIKDDDLIGMKKKKNNKKKERRREGNNSPVTDERVGGKQPVGFIFNREWWREMEKITGERKHFNGFSEEFEKLTAGIVSEPVNLGWWLFSFRGGKTVSGTIFKFKANLPVKVSLIDLFCRGDSFAVLDDGKLIAQSSRVRADMECDETMISPQAALADGRWSSVVFELDSGDHFIELKTVDGVGEGGGGLAAIKFEYILPAGIKERRISREKVCRGFNGLFVVKAGVEEDEAESVCLTMRSELAKADLGDPAVWKSLKTCLGRDGRVWALSKDKKDTITIGLEGKKAKYLKDDAKQRKAVLCRARL